MKTILILIVCACGAASVLYAAVSDGGGGFGILKELNRMVAQEITLDGFVHGFAPIATLPAECDQYK